MRLPHVRCTLPCTMIRDSPRCFPSSIDWSRREGQRRIQNPYAETKSAEVKMCRESKAGWLFRNSESTKNVGVGAQRLAWLVLGRFRTLTRSYLIMLVALL